MKAYERSYGDWNTRTARLDNQIEREGNQKGKNNIRNLEWNHWKRNDI